MMDSTKVELARKRLEEMDEIDGVPFASMPPDIQAGAIQEAIATGFNTSDDSLIYEAYVMAQNMRDFFSQKVNSPDKRGGHN